MKHKKKKYKSYDPFWKLASIHFIHRNKKKYVRSKHDIKYDRYEEV